MDSNGLPLKCYMIFLSYFQYFENNNILFYPLFCVTHVYQDCHEYQVLINVFFCLGCQEIKKPFWGTRSSTLGSFDMSFPFTYIAEDFYLKLTKPSIYLMATNYMINKRYFTKFFVVWNRVKIIDVFSFYCYSSVLWQVSFGCWIQSWTLFETE